MDINANTSLDNLIFIQEMEKQEKKQKEKGNDDEE